MPIALTGPAAAARHGLDGFKDHHWSSQWCAPNTDRHQPGLLRTRLWLPPMEIDGILVVPPQTAVRHLHDLTVVDRMPVLDRVELAVEHVLRIDVELAHDPHALVANGGRQRGDALVREVLARRPHGEPPTESYAETRLCQKLREGSIRCWRQVWVAGDQHRVDIMIPFRQNRRRPPVVTPLDGLLLECDSKEHHLERFEEDHRRDTTYDDLGFRWLSFTPTQVEQDWPRLHRTILRLVAAGRPEPVRPRRRPRVAA